MSIVWEDDHASNYDLIWLMERNFSAENRKRYLKQVYRPEFRLWTKENFEQIFQSFDFNDVMNTNEGKLERAIVLRLILSTS